MNNLFIKVILKETSDFKVMEISIGKNKSIMKSMISNFFLMDKLLIMPFSRLWHLVWHANTMRMSRNLFLQRRKNKRTLRYIRMMLILINQIFQKYFDDDDALP